MLEKIVAGAKNAVIVCTRSIGETVKRLVAPSRAIVGVARDAVRPRTELVAENALLRQQLIVARRNIKRPPLRDGDRVHPDRAGESEEWSGLDDLVDEELYSQEWAG